MNALQKRAFDDLSSKLFALHKHEDGIAQAVEQKLNHSAHLYSLKTDIDDIGSLLRDLKNSFDGK